MFNDFKKFAGNGKVMDLAVGVIAGAAFGKIVSSLVADILMPPIGLLLGKVDLANLFVDLSGRGYATLAAAKAAGAATINYGVFLNTVADFTVVAFCIVLAVRQMNRTPGPAVDAPVPVKHCEFCQSSISLMARRCPNCTSVLDEPGFQAAFGD